jgi:NADH-quinone oxidoreductase subunit J
LFPKLIAGAIGIAILAMIFAMTKSKAPDVLRLPANYTATQIAQQGAIQPVAGPLFQQYLLAFEITSVLLLAAIVGAVALARRREVTDAG